jgi:hypothetical protein
MFPAMLGAAALLGALSISATENSFVLLETDVQAVESGELFEVQVLTSAHTPVNAVDITVQFPKDKLEVFSVDRGQSVLTIWTEDPSVTASAVRFSGGTFRRGFIGKHEIATINFRALETGQYNVKINNATLVAGDGTGTEVPVTAQSAESIAMFNFDDNTAPEEIKVAIASGIVTDLNNDGKVTLQDISAFMGAWSNRSQIFDFNKDGRMTFRDFSIILADYFLQ